MLLHEKIEKILTELNNENLNVKEAKDSIVSAIFFTLLKHSNIQEKKHYETNVKKH